MTEEQRNNERRERSQSLRVKFAGKMATIAQEKQQEREATAQAIDRARIDAAVAIDMWLEGGDTIERRREFFDKTVDMAVTAQCFNRPRSQGLRRRWIVRAANGDAIANNIHCRFCNGLLLPRQKLRGEHTQATDSHTIPCGLYYLAGVTRPIELNESCPNCGVLTSSWRETCKFCGEKYVTEGAA